MKNLKPDYEKTSKELNFWMTVHAQMFHEWTHQIFRTWIQKNWERIGEIKTLHLKSWYNPEAYVNSFIEEFESKVDGI